MTLQSLFQDLELLKVLHPFTETNVESVCRQAGEIVLQFEGDMRDQDLADARENEERTAKQLEESDKENAELTEQLNKAEELSENNSDGSLEIALAECERFRLSATEWAVEVQQAREEVTALRKKKGVAVGFIGQQRKILDLLARLVEYPNEKGLKELANEILHNIYQG